MICEGSAHDSKLLNDALSRRNGLKVPQGKYFLAECGFANQRQFLAPYRGVRYHLKDFAEEELETANDQFLDDEEDDTDYDGFAYTTVDDDNEDEEVEKEE
ncbi:hypothetical protein Q3G72_000690 [Acer saccharum]|nr:hypothetical protein Q3G72_000690 [Acer saccharum]